MPEKNWIFKILLIGPAAVGKTSLLYRFVNKKFAGNYITTMGANFLTKILKLEKNSVNLQLWDIGGQQRFKSLHQTFYKAASGALIIFDLTRAETYDKVEMWRSEMIEILKDEVPFALIGNKADLLEDVGRAVDGNEAKKYAEDKGSFYIETSAKTGENVEEAFIELTRRMMKHNLEKFRVDKGKKTKKKEKKEVPTEK